MNRALQIIVVIALSLWLGGLVALFLFVSALFRNDRTVALSAAPILFKVFSNYQIIVGLIAINALIFWRARVRSKSIGAIAILVIASLATAGFVAIKVIPEMEVIRLSGQSGTSPRFKMLHGVSMILYVVQMIALLLAAMLLPAAVRSDEAARIAPEDPAERGFPVAAVDRASTK